jgi:PKD repeat protein
MKNNKNIRVELKKTVVLWIIFIFIFCSITPVITSQNVKNIDNPCLLPLDSGSSWWNTNWEYRKEITINHSKVDANLIYFPVLISLDSDVDLANNAQNDGDDIVFIDKSSNKLNHEIEYFNGSEGELIAWVNVTSISSTEDTTIYIYYGNPTCGNQQDINGVWNSNFVMVQHLNESSGTHYDSTYYGNDGSPHGTLNQDAIGKVDGADEFDGIDDYIEVLDNESLHLSNAITIEVWAKTNNFNVYRVIATKDKPSKSEWAFFYNTDNKLDFKFNGQDGNNINANTVITDSDWHHLVGVYNGSHIYVFVDGVLDSTPLSYSDINTNTGTVNIGYTKRWGCCRFNGILDEFRIFNVAKNASWISTEYKNQKEPSTFYNIGNEEISNIKPTANFTYSPENPSKLDIIQFTDTSNDPDGEIISWSWDFGDGNTSTSQNPTHQYNEIGTYQVSLNVTDDNEAYDEIIKIITVANIPPTADFTYLPEDPSPGDIIYFTDESIDPDGTIINWTWDFGDETSSSHEQNPTHIYEKNGLYTVVLTIKDDNDAITSTSKDIDVGGDTTPPSVKIIKPERGVYFRDRKILPRFFGLPLIIGKITIEANAIDEDSGIEKVEFYINGKLMGNDPTEPYQYIWTRDRLRLFHIFTIEVKAYNNEGLTSKDSMIVRKFL